MRSSSKPDLVLLPEFEQSGGTRTFFLRLLHVLAGMGVRARALVSDHQLDAEIRTALDRPGIAYTVAPIWPAAAPKLHGRFPFGPIYDELVRACLWHDDRDAPIVLSTGSPGRWLGLFGRARKGLYILHTVPSAPLDPLSRRLVARRLGATHRMLTVSQFAGTAIRERWLHLGHGSPCTAIGVVHNCGDFPDDEPQAARAAGGRRRVLTLGHVTPYKNPELWIELAADVQSRCAAGSVEFVWAGDGPLLERCRGTVASLGLAHVSFVGHQQDVRALFTGCDVYLQPSTIENHCISILTAMQLGIPCVVSPAGGSPESVAHGDTGFVLPLTEKERWVDAVVRLLDDRALNDRMGTAGRRRYRSLFSQAAWATEMEGQLRSWLS